jgi:hypothetical protein
VAGYVTRRDAGLIGQPQVARLMLIDGFLPQVEAWVQHPGAPPPGPLSAVRGIGDELRLEDLGVLLRRHRADDTVAKAITRLLKAELVIVDDIGLLPVATHAAEGLYRRVDAAYEKRSVAISSNLHPSHMASTSSCPKRWPPPPSTDSCTTPTSAKPAATASDSPKPSPAKE